jgi:hypothetical protein
MEALDLLQPHLSSVKHIGLASLHDLVNIVFASNICYLTKSLCRPFFYLNLEVIPIVIS